MRFPRLAGCTPERGGKHGELRDNAADEAMGKLRELLPEKRRKDAVLCVEYVMTASPEWWDKLHHGSRRSFSPVLSNG
ncbi:plasmid recombination protein [Escherichia coli]|uniref:plasmid recombination protein n=1 Tax=Escherichia coli TaxID=562 RepID=UPI00202CC7B9|nr:plasmid recombination protein [Escherichia coli]